MPKHFSSSHIKIWLAVCLWSAVLYAIVQMGTSVFFEITVWPGVWIKDAFSHLLLGSLLFLLCRGFWPWAMAYSLTVILLQLGNALKFVILGSPIMPDDFAAAPNMLQLFDDWRLYVMWAALLVPLILWIYALAWHKKLTWVVLGSLVLTGFGFVQFSTVINRGMDKYLGDRIWDQPGNYRDRGLVLHIVHEASRSLARGQITLTPEQIKQAKAAVLPSGLIAHKPDAMDGRNLYIILLESFWDPMNLKAAGISEDPFDPRFRALWQTSNNSTVLAPVYGGYTANSEFEVLCGFPVINDAVFFEGWLRRQVPCLPRYLANAGYQTVASHPNYAAFWNRVNAYNRLGFQHYWSKTDFELDDLNRSFLGDQSLYRQVWNKNRELRENKQPLFNYIVTIFGHLDYPLNQRRPKKISVENDPGMVEGYVNTIYYKTRELMDFYQQLREKDPTAVIVMFGDHLPFLGPKFAGYVESGLLASAKSAFTAEMFQTYAETPLIIVDGENGVVEKHRLPMFRVPALISKLLGDSNKSLLSLTELPEGQALRPLPGITLLSSADQPKLCIAGDLGQDCIKAEKWLDNITTLSGDIFSGQQQSLQQ